jgi:hypothetical protein
MTKAIGSTVKAATITVTAGMAMAFGGLGRAAQHDQPGQEDEQRAQRQGHAQRRSRPVRLAGDQGGAQRRGGHPAPRGAADLFAQQLGR